MTQVFEEATRQEKQARTSLIALGTRQKVYTRLIEDTNSALLLDQPPTVWRADSNHSGGRTTHSRGLRRSEVCMAV